MFVNVSHNECVCRLNNVRAHRNSSKNIQNMKNGETFLNCCLFVDLINKLYVMWREYMHYTTIYTTAAALQITWIGFLQNKIHLPKNHASIDELEWNIVDWRAFFLPIFFF